LNFQEFDNTEKNQETIKKINTILNLPDVGEVDLEEVANYQYNRLKNVNLDFILELKERTFIMIKPDGV
jgi:hypothetical protein